MKVKILLFFVRQIIPAPLSLNKRIKIFWKKTDFFFSNIGFLGSFWFIEARKIYVKGNWAARKERLSFLLCKLFELDTFQTKASPTNNNCLLSCLPCKHAAHENRKTLSATSVVSLLESAKRSHLATFFVPWRLGETGIECNWNFNAQAWKRKMQNLNSSWR